VRPQAAPEPGALKQEADKRFRELRTEIRNSTTEKDLNDIRVMPAWDSCRKAIVAAEVGAGKTADEAEAIATRAMQTLTALLEDRIATIQEAQ
jgi:hypothetical protein